MLSCDDAAHLVLTELETDISRNLKLEESNKKANIKLIESQTEVNWEMREQLVEFLLQSQVALNLCDETLALAIHLLDRYMSKRYVYAKLYQLLGTVCLWLASKVCDDKRKILTTQALSYVCANTYPESMFKDMELHVLSTLEWNLLTPTPLDFIDIEVSNAVRSLSFSGIHCDMESYNTIIDMAKYLCECSLYYKDFVQFSASVVASSAVVLSGFVFDSSKGYNWPMLSTSCCVQECFDAFVTLAPKPPTESFHRYSNPNNSYASVIFEKYFAGNEQSSGFFPTSPISEHYLYDEESLYSPTSEADSFILPLSPQSIISDHANPAPQKIDHHPRGFLDLASTIYE